MYRLVQAKIIAHTALKENLQPFGYEPVPITPVFWCHNNNGMVNLLLVTPR